MQSPRGACVKKCRQDKCMYIFNKSKKIYLQKMYGWMIKCHARSIDVVKPKAKPASDLMKWSGAFNLSEGVFWLDVITAVPTLDHKMEYDRLRCVETCPAYIMGSDV